MPRKEYRNHGCQKRKPTNIMIENEMNPIVFIPHHNGKKLRDYFIKRNPLCKWCNEEGKTKVADVVDHILPIKQGGSKIDESNLQSLCHHHHNQKSGWDQKRKKQWNIKPIIK